MLVSSVAGETVPFKERHIPNRAVVDHNHRTGKVRGLLCGSCNRGLGAMQENINILARAIEYLCRYETLRSNYPEPLTIPDNRDYQYTGETPRWWGLETGGTSGEAAEPTLQERRKRAADLRAARRFVKKLSKPE